MPFFELVKCFILKATICKYPEATMGFDPWSPTTAFSLAHQRAQNLQDRAVCHYEGSSEAQCFNLACPSCGTLPSLPTHFDWRSQWSYPHTDEQSFSVSQSVALTLKLTGRRTPDWEFEVCMPLMHFPSHTWHYGGKNCL